jgi:hydroxyethylthiazole kinase-like uncharacterized protein yjeF
MPDPGDSKKSRGRVIAVGGSRRSPGAVLLAGEAALRVGAGRLGLLVSASIEAQLGIVMPEAAVFPLPDESDATLQDDVHDEVAAADAVLVGPGFDDPDETRATLLTIADATTGCLVVDAFALGVLPDVDRDRLPERLILTPNREETEILLGRELGDDAVGDLREIAHRFDAVVACYGDIVAPDGSAWHISAGGPGLGTSGSGDVLVGAVAGLAARGMAPERAAVWGTWVHMRAGDVLTERMGIGFLARDLLVELTVGVTEVLRGDQR